MELNKWKTVDLFPASLDWANAFAQTLHERLKIDFEYRTGPSDELYQKVLSVARIFDDRLRSGEDKELACPLLPLACIYYYLCDDQKSGRVLTNHIYKNCRDPKLLHIKYPLLWLTNTTKHDVDMDVELFFLLGNIGDKWCWPSSVFEACTIDMVIKYHQERREKKEKNQMDKSSEPLESKLDKMLHKDSTLELTGDETTAYYLLRSMSQLVKKYEKSWMYCDPGTADYAQMQLIFLDDIWELYMELLASTAEVINKCQTDADNNASDSEKAKILDRLLNYLWFIYQDAFAAKEDGRC